MKRYISNIAVGLALLSFASCSKDTEGLTGITYYAVIELDGPEIVEAIAGVPYVEPGFTATMKGENVNDEVVISTDMNFADPQPGYYAISYSVVNPDGFATSAVRYVFVTDPNDPVAGYYTTDPESFRETETGTTFYGAPFSVTVVGVGEGKYEVTDLLGGWYEQRAGYGSDYACQGDIEISNDGTVTLLDSYVIGWGDSADDLYDGKFDEATNTLSWVVSYAGMDFHVIMTKDE